MAVLPSNRVERDRLHHVVVVTARIEQQLRRLDRAGIAGGAHHDGERAGPVRAHAEVPGAKGEATEILAERRATPGGTAVAGQFHRFDAMAAVPGDALDAETAGGDAG